MTDKGHHVHFNEENYGFGKDNEILVESSANGDTLKLHLGFLQISHRYEIIVTLPIQCDTDFIEADCLPGSVQSINCKIVEMTQITDGLQIKLELLAYKEKLLKELLYITSCGSDAKPITLIIMARVLGKGKGTPLIKNGIHCISIEQDDESEASDWQGFD